MATVAHLWRHPIKAHGREALEMVALSEGETLPWDRHWAVAHEAAKTTGSEWAHCANFSRGSKAPGLMEISAKLDEATARVTLSHADREPLEFAPNDSPVEFFDWVRPLMPEGRAASARIVKGPRGMTDSDFPSISVMNIATHRAVAGWVDDLPNAAGAATSGSTAQQPGKNLTGSVRTLRLGTAVLEVKVRERIARCMATTANPDNWPARRRHPLVRFKDRGWGHQDFGTSTPP